VSPRSGERTETSTVSVRLCTANNVMPNQSPDQIRNDEIEGRYSNYFLVGHNAFEFVIDFGQMYTGMQECIHTRIITTPAYAKELLKTLRESLDQYERQFGGA